MHPSHACREYQSFSASHITSEYQLLRAVVKALCKETVGGLCMVEVNAYAGDMSAEPIEGLVILPRAPYDEELVQRLLMAIELGAALGTACNLVQISLTTLSRWRKADKDLDNRVILATGRRSAYLVGRVRKGAKRDWRAAAWLLEKTDLDYVEKKQVAFDGKVEVEVRYVTRSVEGNYDEEQAE